MNKYAYDKLLGYSEIYRNKDTPGIISANTIHAIITSGGNSAIYLHKHCNDILNDVLGKNRTEKDVVEFITSYRYVRIIGYNSMLVMCLLCDNNLFDRYYQTKKRYIKYLLNQTRHNTEAEYMILIALIWSDHNIAREIIFRNISEGHKIDSYYIISLLKECPELMVKAIRRKIIGPEDVLYSTLSRNLDTRIIKIGFKKIGHITNSYIPSPGHTNKSLCCMFKCKNTKLNLSIYEESLVFMILSRRHRGIEIPLFDYSIHKISTIIGIAVFGKNLTKLAFYYV